MTPAVRMQLACSLNGTLSFPVRHTYAYRAMLETLLSYGEDAKKSQLTVNCSTKMTLVE